MFILLVNIKYWQLYTYSGYAHISSLEGGERLLTVVIKCKCLKHVNYGFVYFSKIKYSRAFVKRPSQGTSSLISRLTTMSLDVWPDIQSSRIAYQYV